MIFLMVQSIKLLLRILTKLEELMEDFSTKQTPIKMANCIATNYKSEL